MKWYADGVLQPRHLEDELLFMFLGGRIGDDVKIDHLRKCEFSFDTEHNLPTVTIICASSSFKSFLKCRRKLKKDMTIGLGWPKE